MKTMTPRELKRYLDELRPRRFILWTENQPWYDVADPLKLTLTFDSIHIGDDVRILTFQRNGESVGFLDGVKCIDTDACTLGTLLTVHCRDYWSYHIIAQ